MTYTLDVYVFVIRFFLIVLPRPIQNLKFVSQLAKALRPLQVYIGNPSIWLQALARAQTQLFAREPLKNKISKFS